MIAKMKCLECCVLLTVVAVSAAKFEIKDELMVLAQQIDMMKTLHLNDVERLKNQIEELRKNQQKPAVHLINNQARNEQATLEWAKTSMNELRVEMRELNESVNNSALLRQLHGIHNELKQALTEASDLMQLVRMHETRVDKLDNEAGRLKYENQQTRNMLAELRSQVRKLAKEIKSKQMSDQNPDNYNEVLDEHEAVEASPAMRSHKIRHNKMVHTQISRLARTQDQLDEYQQSLQTQLLDVQRRLDRFEEPNWNLLSAKVEFLELETKGLRSELKNTSQKLSDFDKVHASMLELREDVESIENKADKTFPEFRKEISKLDISFAKLNAESSYLKEDEENLRQSVKAIAVSVSNAIDRAEMDRLAIQRINDTVADLATRSKEHHHRLNDHILKSEANNINTNQSEIIPLPELIVEVRELQPVQREYEDLVNQLPRDCSSVSGPAGSYLVRPGRAPVDTWCANGSTLLQRRINGTVEFNRKLDEYVNGFGDPAAEFWMGLDSMHQLAADNCSSMRIDMTDIYGGFWYAHYENFYVGSGDTGYVLEVSGFSGNASDAFEYQNHMAFSAIDRDRDTSNTHCAGNYEGGWWFSHCQHVNINGKYSLGLTWFNSDRNEWIAVATSEMRMYRKQGCS